MPEEIVLVAYDSRWPELYKSMETKLLSVVGEYIEDIQHVGSTAVPDLAAKPVIDMMIGVSSLDIADAHCIQPIVGCGFHFSSRTNPPTRRYFTRDDAAGNRTHNVHLVEIESEWWDRHILFRDYLRVNEEARTVYERLKRELAKEEYERTSDYADRKTEFIKEVEEAARIWRKNL